MENGNLPYIGIIEQFFSFFLLIYQFTNRIIPFIEINDITFVVDKTEDIETKWNRLPWKL